MKLKSWIVLSLALPLSACGKYTVKHGTTVFTVDTSVISTASADIQTCPSGMTLFPTGVGYQSFCMDNTPSATGGGTVPHGTALTACMTQGKNLCSVSQLVIGCHGLPGFDHTNIYWASNMTGYINPEAAGFDGTGSTCPLSNVGIWGLNTSHTSAYYCCSQ